MCRSESESGSDIEEIEVGSLDLGAGLSGYEVEWSETDSLVSLPHSLVGCMEGLA